MKHKTFVDTSYLLSQAFNLRDADARFVAHEIAHALLLFGRVWPGMGDATEQKIDAMPVTRANDHEMRTCALELHGLWRLRQKITARWIADQAWSGLANLQTVKKYRTKVSFEHAILAEAVSPMLVDRFVRIYRDFSRYA